MTAKASQRGATREIARFVVETPAGSVPAETLKSIDLSCFDAVGVAMGGAAEEVSRIVTRMVRARGGPPEATLFGSGERVSAPQAALANGAMAHALDYDDFGGFGHPTVAILPAALAAAELVGAPGLAVAEAFAIGFEIGLGLCQGGRYNQGDGGFHSTSVFGTVAAAAACARILGLDVQQTMMALGIAASEAGGIGRNNGTMTKPLHAGLAARGGLESALLAREGLTSAPDIFEARQGFCEAFLGFGKIDLRTVIDELGNPFRHQHWMTLKKYPCCGSAHSALDAVLGLVRDHDISFDDIDTVVVGGMEHASGVLRYPEPATGLNGKFSVHHTVAAAILDGHVGIEHFTQGAVTDARLAAARRKVRADVLSRWDPRSMYPDSTADPVTVRLLDGTELSRSVERGQILGHPRNPWPQDEVERKFRANAARLFNDGAALERSLVIWLHLSKIEQVSEAIAALATACEAAQP